MMNDDIETIKRDIAATRERLNASVEALVYRADVPARAKDAVEAKIQNAKVHVSGLFRRSKHVLDAARPLSGELKRMSGAAPEKLGDPLARLEERPPVSQLTKGQLEDMQTLVARNPLGFVLTSVAVGLLIGLAFPISEIERDTVGPLGQHLLDDASSAAGDVIERGKTLVATMTGEL